MEKGIATNLIKTLIFTIVVPATVAIYIPHWLVSARPPVDQISLGPFHFLGLAGIALGAAIYFWCAWDFATVGRGTPAPIDPPKELVVRGLYRQVRNPMYVGVLSVVFGEAIFFESLRLFGWGLFLGVLFNAFVRFYEEPVLRSKFGGAYERYCDRVPRWIPRIHVHIKERP